MNRKHLVSQVVKLRSADGIIERVVARDLGEVLMVCRPEEYHRARAEAREPAMIGFRRSDLIDSTGENQD
jgi:hypothetical protein